MILRKEIKNLFSSVIQLPNTELSDVFLRERQTICLTAILSECCIICSSLLKSAASLNLNTIFHFKSQKEEHMLTSAIYQRDFRQQGRCAKNLGIDGMSLPQVARYFETEERESACG